MRISEKQHLSLVLSGGGVKAAAFHVGVCLALQEKGFKFAGGTRDDVSERYKDTSMTFRTYVGSSAGSMISALLASGHSVENLMEAFEMGTTTLFKGLRQKDKGTMPPSRLKPLTYSDIFSVNGINLFRLLPRSLAGTFQAPLVQGGLETLVKHGFKLNGLFTTAGLEKYLRRHVLPTNRFDELGVDLFVVASQLNHSRKTVFGSFSESAKDKEIHRANFSSISEAVAASTSLPPVFAPYPVRNDSGREIYYFDGEIRETLSTHVAAENGADLIIASYSHQPYHYNEAMGSLHNYGIPAIINQAIYQVVEQKIQKHIQHQQDIRSVFSIVDGYFKQAGLPSEHRDKLLEILETRFKHHPNTDYIYIHPNPQDYEMFFADHFSLNPKILGKIVKSGFKAAISRLRKYNI